MDGLLSKVHLLGGSRPSWSTPASATVKRTSDRGPTLLQVKPAGKREMGGLNAWRHTSGIPAGRSCSSSKMTCSRRRPENKMTWHKPANVIRPLGSPRMAAAATLNKPQVVRTATRNGEERPPVASGPANFVCRRPRARDGDNGFATGMAARCRGACRMGSVPIAEVAGCGQAAQDKA